MQCARHIDLISEAGAFANQFSSPHARFSFAKWPSRNPHNAEEQVTYTQIQYTQILNTNTMHTNYYETVYKYTRIVFIYQMATPRR